METDRILTELRSGDKYLGELSDATQMPYSTLRPLLSALLEKGRIEIVMKPIEGSAVMAIAYRAIPPRPFWMPINSK